MRGILVLVVLLYGLLLLGEAWCEDYGPVMVELRGDARSWTETGPVFETVADAKYQTERYGPRFSYALQGLPTGPARLKLGFCEFKHKEPGKRVFDILANGRALFKGFDILARGDQYEAVVVAADVSVKEDEPLVIEFVGKTEFAKLNWLKLYTDTWVFEVKASDGPRIELNKPSRDAAFMHEVYETCIGKFGSRICINPRPQEGICRQTALGHADYNVAYFERNPELYDDPATAVYYAVRCEGTDATSRVPTEKDIWYSLPFNGRLPAFSRIEQEQTLTSLSYTCRASDLPLEVTYTFRAPFYPEDLELCVAPFILLDVSVRNLTTREQRGTIVVGQSLRSTDRARKVSDKGCRGVAIQMPVFEKNTQLAWLVDEPAAEDITAHVGTLSIPPARAETSTAAAQQDSDQRAILTAKWFDAPVGLAWDFTLGPRAQTERTFVCVGWMGGKIIEVMGEPYHFKYVDLFTDLLEVARYAFDEREEIDRKVALFESTVYDATAPQALKEFLAFAFQSWVQNTFYCANSEGKDWFSVWEGCCKFHSTVDVEYNVAPLYFEYWPDLMRMTLDQWVNYIHDGILSHDMGMGLEANGMKYGHDMEVEENTNFALLLHQYWRRTADGQTLAKLFPFAQELLEHVTACDTDGDGFHEKGTYNTIDQGSAAVQYAKDQTYLAVRALCAYECGAQMAEALENEDQAKAWREQAAIVAKTLEAEAWLKDHYVVSLNQPPKQQHAPARSTAGVGDTGDGDGWNQPRGETEYDYQNWNAQPRPSTYQPVRGWDGYSIYTTNGMLYPMRVGLELPGVNLPRIITDLHAATSATLKQYGSPHTDRESNMWVSQNLWRDMAAAYLGIDMIDNVERYWDLQKYINRKKRGCFTDVYVYGSDHISLDYYPRGVAAFGLIPALAGLQVDKVAGRVSVAPLRSPLRVPLLAYADWASGKVPWLNIIAEGAGAGVGVEGEPGVEVRTREPGEVW